MADMATSLGIRRNTAAPNEGKKATGLVYGEHLKETKARMETETLQKQESLSKSKGQAQITATTAMSIVNVALLKSVIDRGGENNKYYEVSLVLISLSLVLQVLAGLISLAIEHSLSYLSKHRHNMCEDVRESCCPWRCVRHENSTDQHQHDTSGKTTSFEVTDFHDDIETNLESSPICGFCPCKCTAVLYEHYETTALRMHSKWECSSVAVELKAIHAEESLQGELRYIERMERDLEELTTKLENVSERTETENAIEELSAILKESQERRNRYESEMQQFKIFKEQGHLLKECTVAIKKDRVMRMATFWQYVLNYIFYVIFTLNAFITGFGLASSPPPQPQQALNVSNTQAQ